MSVRSAIAATVATAAVALVAGTAGARERIVEGNTAYPSTPQLGGMDASRGGSRLYARFACPAGGFDCHGRVEILTNSRFHATGVFRRVVIGFEERRFYTPSGTASELALTIPRAACDRLRRTGKLGVLMTVRLRRPGGADKVMTDRDVLRIDRRSGGCPR